MVVAVWPVALLLLGLACAFLIATNKTYQYTIGALLENLARLFERIGFGVSHFHVSLSPLAKPIRALNSLMLQWIGTGIDATSHALVYVWSQLTHVVTELGQALGDLAEATEHALVTLTTHTVPRLVRHGSAWATKPLEASVNRLRAALATAEATAAGAVAGLAATLTADLAHVQRWIRHATHAAAVALDAGLAWPKAKIRGLERDAANVGARLGRISKTLTVAGIVGLSVAALGRLGLGWTRCSKVGRLGRAVCGMDEGIIDSLIVGSLVFAGSISVVQLAREVQAFTGEADDALRFFVRELR